MGKLSRSWALVQASLQVLRSDRELLVFPLVSGIAALVVAASFLAPVFGLGLLDRVDGDGISAGMAAWLFAFYLAQYFVIFFFNTALVGAAMIRLDGGDPTVGAGLRIAAGKVWPILGYAAIAATVGLLLRALEERAGVLGRLVIGLLGVAWTAATFLVVPVLVTRNVGPVDAVRESATLLGRTWGENLIGNVGIGLAFGLLTAGVALGGVALVAFLATQQLVVLAVAAAVVAVLAVLSLALVQAALSGIYSAALYRFAVQGEAPAGFDGALLQEAFQRKV